MEQKIFFVFLRFIGVHFIHQLQPYYPQKHLAMIIATCLLILAYTLTGHSIEPLLDRLRNVKWIKRFARLGKRLKGYALKVGRFTARPVLQLYYVVTDEQTSLADKALIYGCLVYVLMPHSLIPSRIYKLLGLTDEAVAIIAVVKKVNSKITDEINAKVDATLDSWFNEENNKKENPSNDTDLPKA